MYMLAGQNLMCGQYTGYAGARSFCLHFSKKSHNLVTFAFLFPWPTRQASKQACEASKEEDAGGPGPQGAAALGEDEAALQVEAVAEEAVAVVVVGRGYLVGGWEEASVWSVLRVASGGQAVTR